MTTPEAPRETSESYGFHEDHDDIGYDQAEKVTDAINALTVEFPNGGHLTNLVWNIRNNYLCTPGATFDAEQVQKLVEGFLQEVSNSNPQLMQSQLRSSS